MGRGRQTEVVTEHGHFDAALLDRPVGVDIVQRDGVRSSTRDGHHDAAPLLRLPRARDQRFSSNLRAVRGHDPYLETPLRDQERFSRCCDHDVHRECE
jgi:hypothetical protein